MSIAVSNKSEFIESFEKDMMFLKKVIEEDSTNSKENVMETLGIKKNTFNAYYYGKRILPLDKREKLWSLISKEESPKEAKKEETGITLKEEKNDRDPTSTKDKLHSVVINSKPISNDLIRKYIMKVPEIELFGKTEGLSEFVLEFRLNDDNSALLLDSFAVNLGNTISWIISLYTTTKIININGSGFLKKVCVNDDYYKVIISFGSTGRLSYRS